MLGAMNILPLILKAPPVPAECLKIQELNSVEHEEGKNRLNPKKDKVYNPTYR